MSVLSSVRIYIADPILYGISDALSDGLDNDFLTPYFPVVPDSEKVWVNDVLQTKPADYIIDNSLGLVSFVSIPPAGNKVKIKNKYSLLSDLQLQELITNYGDSYEDTDTIRIVSADALDIIASSEALIQKKITMLDLQTDGPALAEALRKHAQALRDQVLSLSGEEASFEIIEQINDLNGWLETIYKDAAKNL